MTGKQGGEREEDQAPHGDIVFKRYKMIENVNMFRAGWERECAMSPEEKEAVHSFISHLFKQQEKATRQSRVEPVIIIIIIRTSTDIRQANQCKALGDTVMLRF